MFDNEGNEIKKNECTYVAYREEETEGRTSKVEVETDAHVYII